MIVILFALAVVLAFFTVAFLGPLPGKIAVKRNHPKAKLIHKCGWIGIFVNRYLWLVALIWAFRDSQRQAIDFERKIVSIRQKSRLSRIFIDQSFDSNLRPISAKKSL